MGESLVAITTWSVSQDTAMPFGCSVRQSGRRDTGRSQILVTTTLHGSLRTTSSEAEPGKARFSPPSALEDSHSSLL